MGESRLPMLIILLNLCVVRTVLLFIIVPRMQNVQGVAMCYPITWVLTALCMPAGYLRYWKRLSIKA